MSAASSATSAIKKVDGGSGKPDANLENEDEGVEVGPEGEDTMKNLRKTFAGIFGDIG